MKKGDLVTGNLVGFTYVGQNTSWCKVSVAVNDDTHKMIAGPAVAFPMPMMMQLKGANASVQAEYDGENEYGPAWKNVEFVI